MAHRFSGSGPSTSQPSRPYADPHLLRKVEIGSTFFEAERGHCRIDVMRERGQSAGTAVKGNEALLSSSLRWRSQRSFSEARKAELPAEKKHDNLQRQKSL